MNIEKYLLSHNYPGRIIIGGNLKNGEPVLIYALTGRSESSKERVLYIKEGNLFTKSIDKSDNPLLVYQATIETNQGKLLGNGDHIKTIKEGLDNGKSFLESLETLGPEPDKLNTPRLALLVNKDKSYSLAEVLFNGEKVERRVWTYKITPGFGHIIHTYQGNEDNPEAFNTDPAVVNFGTRLSSFIDAFWSNINKEYRVSLYAHYNGGDKIINEARA